MSTQLISWSELEARARLYALAAHTSIGQRRKYTNEPYIVHPTAVAALVRQVPHTWEMLAAAWLHDVVEDTKCTILDIGIEFGGSVAALVAEVTDVSRPTDGNRARRKALDLVHLSRASSHAKTIKLADLIDNSRSIVAHDPNFAVVYLEEKAALLEVLRAGDRILWAMANEIVQQHKAKVPSGASL